jgi:hypothetical protein
MSVLLEIFATLLAWGAAIAWVLTRPAEFDRAGSTAKTPEAGTHA